MKKGNKKTIYQYTVSGVYVSEHPSIAAAAKSLGISRETISLVLRKKNKTARKYQFSYEKVERMEPVEYVKNRMMNVCDIGKKEKANLTYTDFGIITNPMSRDYGKRKLIIGKMEVYAHPDKPIDAIVEKWSNAI